MVRRNRDFCGSVVPLTIAWVSFIAALLIWGFSKGLGSHLLGTAIGLGGFFFAEIVYARRRHRFLRESGGLLLLWWLFLSPMMVKTVGDVTGLYRLGMLYADAESIITLGNLEYFLIIPTALLHFWLQGGIKLQTRG